jgi:Zn-dependent protease with chaperone function
VKQSLSSGDKLAFALASNVDVFAMSLIMLPLLLGSSSLFEPFVRNELMEVVVSFLAGGISCFVVCAFWVLPMRNRAYKRLCNLRGLDWKEFNERQKAGGSLLDQVSATLSWLTFMLMFLIDQVVFKNSPMFLIFQFLSFVAAAFLFSQVLPLLVLIFVHGNRSTSLTKQLDDLSRGLKIHSPSLRVSRSDDRGYLNAFAFSSNLYGFIVVNRSVEELNTKQKEALLAHELAHVKGHHIMITFALSLLLATLVTTILYVCFESRLQYVEFFALLSMGSYFTIRLSSHLIERHFEKAADVAAARIVGARNYVQLLKILERQDLGLGIGGVTRAFMDTHPAPNERIELVLARVA